MSKIYLVVGTNSGSQSWTNSALWSAGVVPTTGDDVYLMTGGGIRFDSGLSQGTNYLNSLTTSVSGPKVGGLGTNCLQIGVANQFHGVANVDGSGGNGSQCIKINSGTWQTNINFYANSNQSGEAGMPPAVFLGANTNNALYQVGGVVALALTSPADTSTFGTISTEGGTLYVGPGVQFTKFINNGCTAANLQAGSNGCMIVSLGGNTTTQGTFAVGNAQALGGNLILNHRPATGTMVGSLILNGGTLDLSQNPSTGTMGATIWGSGKIKVFQDGQINWGTVTPSFGGKETMSVEIS